VHDKVIVLSVDNGNPSMLRETLQDFPNASIANLPATTRSHIGGEELEAWESSRDCIRNLVKHIPGDRILKYDMKRVIAEALPTEIRFAKFCSILKRLTDRPNRKVNKRGCAAYHGGAAYVEWGRA
jgi:hypothetical protein